HKPPMSDTSSTNPNTPTSPESTPFIPSTTTNTTDPSFIDSSSSPSLPKVQSAINSLASILTAIPPSLSSTQNPAFILLHDPDISSQISSLLHNPDSGAGDDNLCRWLYNTFQSTDPDLQLVVLRFLPIIAGIYLSRVKLRKPLAGFEAVLLALYAHETTSRAGQPIVVNVPDLSHPSIYHESKTPLKNNVATGLSLAVVSPSLEPHGTVRSTRRARIVGVALELYYSKISQMPVRSKIDFCEFCEEWAGQYDSEHGDKEKPRMVGRICLPWELLQPVLRILGHCLLGTDNRDQELLDVACRACRSLYARSLHDINHKAILATGSLHRLAKLDTDPENNIDHTEIAINNVLSL
ncbi:Hyccin domain-containing protein, partial [Cephalotus follicularis]